MPFPICEEVNTVCFLPLRLEESSILLAHQLQKDLKFLPKVRGIGKSYINVRRVAPFLGIQRNSGYEFYLKEIHHGVGCMTDT